MLKTSLHLAIDLVSKYILSANIWWFTSKFSVATKLHVSRWVCMCNCQPLHTNQSPLATIRKMACSHTPLCIVVYLMAGIPNHLSFCCGTFRWLTGCSKHLRYRIHMHLKIQLINVELFGGCSSIMVFVLKN
jgi:hypothetical protein